MSDYSEKGNEVLAPLAYAGDAEAVRILETRGNVVEAARKVLQKTIVWSADNGNQAKVGDIVVIENGRIASINGVPQG
jgi:hypothetical protein